MTYQVAIPSSGRSDLINLRTLRMLREGGVPRDRIRVFVAPDAVDSYRAEIDPGLCHEVVGGKPGLAANRNFISQWFPAGEHVVHVSDDILELVKRIDEKRLVKAVNLDQYINDAFDFTMEQGAELWGLFPTANPQFMNQAITTDLRVCPRAFFGVINGHRAHNQVKSNHMEDYERTLRYFSHSGKVVRFNFLAAVSPPVPQGGLRPDTAVRQAEAGWIKANWPGLVTTNRTNIRLRPEKTLDRALSLV